MQPLMMVHGCRLPSKQGTIGPNPSSFGWKNGWSMREAELGRSSSFQARKSSSRSTPTGPIVWRKKSGHCAPVNLFCISPRLIGVGVVVFVFVIILCVLCFTTLHKLKNRKHQKRILSVIFPFVWLRVLIFCFSCAFSYACLARPHLSRSRP